MMNRIRTMIGAVALTVALSIVAAPAAYAEEYVCTSSIGAITVDNLFVPAGRSCTLTGTVVQGNIVVGTNASLTASNVRVNGSVQAVGGKNVVVRRGSRVNGDVQLKQGGSANIANTTIGGTLLFQSNLRALKANANSIGGDLQAFQNRGGASITRNVINGNLQCKENAPAPTGFGNTATSKEDQCAGF